MENAPKTLGKNMGKSTHPVLRRIKNSRRTRVSKATTPEPFKDSTCGQQNKVSWPRFCWKTLGTIGICLGTIGISLRTIGIWDLMRWYEMIWVMNRNWTPNKASLDHLDFHQAMPMASMAHGPSALGSNFFGMSGVANGGSAFSRVSTFCLACWRSASSPASVATQRMKKSGGLSSRGHCKPARWNRWSWFEAKFGGVHKKWESPQKLDAGKSGENGWFGVIVHYSHPRWGKLCIWKTWITWHRLCSSDIRMVGKDRRRF